MTQPKSLQAAREQAIDALCRRFADDTLSMPELERRLDHARAARTREELRALLRDLPPPPTVPARREEQGAAAARAGEPEGGPVARRPVRRPPGSGGTVRTSSSAAIAILGGTRRAGKWAPPENMLAMAAMGGVELDFRDAVLEPGSVTSITCFAFWGGIEITVPPDIHVDTGGFALLGGFDQSGEAWPDPDEGAPTIQVNGFAFMGGVEVKVRERGEGAARPARPRRDRLPGRPGRRSSGRWDEDLG